MTIQNIINSGSYLTSNVPIASSVSLTTGVSKDITSLLLPVGDWDLYGNIYITASASTVLNTVVGWMYPASATEPNSSLTIAFVANPGMTFVQWGFVVPYLRYNATTPTTVYLSTQCKFTTSTCVACGTMSARRAR